MFHIFKDSIFTKRVTGSTPFRPLLSYLQNLRIHREGYRLHPFSSSCFTSSKRRFHREGYRLHPFSSSCFISSKTTFSHTFTERVTDPFSSSCFIFSKPAYSPRELPAPPLFILLFHIFRNGIFTKRVTGSTPFHPLVSCLQKRHFHRETYRLHPFSSSCFISSKTTFSPRGLLAPPLFILLFHIFKNDIFTEKIYRLHPFSSSCFKSSKTAFSPRGSPAPPLFILLFQIFKNSFFTERVTGPTPFHPLVSNLQKQHFHREGYRPHPFSSSSFISSKTAFSPRGLPAPPLAILLFHIFKNGILTEKVNYRLHPFSSSSFISSKTAFSPRGLPAPPLFILLFHIFKTAFSPRGLPAPPLFILFFHIFKDGLFTERGTGSTPFHPLVSYLQKRRVQ